MKLEFDARRLQPNSTIVGVRIHVNTSESDAENVKEACEVVKKPVHLALLLDTSGSMDGSRIEAVKKTLRVLISRLSYTDKLTFITYNNNASLLCYAESDKTRLLTLADNIVAEGGTNLESALLSLAQLCLTCSPELFPDSVFLLTDGHMNRGALSTHTLCMLAKSALQGHSVPVCTLGYGADHDAYTLQQIALTTRGTYTFAEDAELIPNVVGDILGTIETLALCDVHITASPGTDCLELKQSHVSVENSHIHWLGNLASNKTHWVLLNVPPTVEPVITLRASVPNTTTSTIIVNPTTYQTDISEQWFRCRTVNALHDVQTYKRNHGCTFGPLIRNLTSLEKEMSFSSVSNTPLVLSLRGSIMDMIRQLECNDLQPSRALRMISNVTTLGTQRGLLLPDPVHDSQETRDFQHMFQSPLQRCISNSFVTEFSQAMTEV